MKFRLAMAFCVVASCATLYAHPLDDDAEMLAKLRVLDDSTLELELEFRYRTVIASYTEFRNGLDRNEDGIVTHDEVRRRFVELADEVAFGLGLSLNGQRINLDPDFSRFQFKDLDNPDASLDAGIDATVARIFYRLVYRWSSADGPPAGPLTLELFFNGPQTVVHTPHEQLFAFSADGEPLDVEYDLALFAFPRMRVVLSVRPEETSPWIENPPQHVPPERELLSGALGLALGSMLTALGVVSLLVGRRSTRKFAMGLMLLCVGAMVIAAGVLQLSV